MDTSDIGLLQLCFHGHETVVLSCFMAIYLGVLLLAWRWALVLLLNS